MDRLETERIEEIQYFGTAQRTQLIMKESCL